MTLLDDLKYRESLFQTTEGLEERIAKGPITVYQGVDPSAESLTIGNLIPLLILRRLQLHGHHAIALVGGGTGLIGDPSGKDAERKLNTAEVVAGFTEKIRREVERFLDFDGGSNPARLVSNYEWLSELKVIDFFRDVGKHFPLSYMLAKESVASRMEAGISFTEFSYMALQAYDFKELYERYGCECQSGGSDQWGNITAGIELVRRDLGKSAYGFTNPLLERSDGKKFGKSEEGAVFLSPELTSPYQFYQWFVNVPDADVIKLIKIFTFMEHSEIDDLAVEAGKSPEKREAQRVLAEEVTSLVHGKEAKERAVRISEALFYGNVKDLTAQEVDEGFRDVPTHALPAQDVLLLDAISSTGIVKSKRQAREDIGGGAIYVNGDRQTDLDLQLTSAHRIAGQFTVIRRGKRNYHLVKWEG